jgi:hypothetical protein
VATTVRLINFRAVGTSLGSVLVLLAGRVEYIAIDTSNLEVDGPLE